MIDMIIDAKSDSEDIRVYINGLLHLKFPRDKNTKIHSWIEGNSKLYIIQIWTAGHKDCVAYDNKQIWEKVLR